MTELIYSDLTYEVRGAIFDVYNELHHLDLSEKGWENALEIALKERGMHVQRQVEYELRYKGYRIGRFFVDMLVAKKLLLELKAETKLLPIDKAQVITYLGVAGLKLGMLINFGGHELEIKRIPNFVGQPTDHSPQSADSPENHLLYPALTRELRGLLYDVHNTLGPGFMHMHYRRAIQIELRRHDIPYTVKKEITLRYRQQPIEARETRLIIVDKRVLLIPIAVRAITALLRQRLRQYLKLLDLKLGLIVNFHTPSLEIETVRVQ
ncbi:MAG: hypothetical protein MAG451_02476 [Anaerolineales bacterium]|nr:hypothetical protein [Anaerolineales bacterium]